MVTRTVQPFNFAARSPSPSAHAKVIAVASRGAHALVMIYLATQQFAASEPPVEVATLPRIIEMVAMRDKAAAHINTEDTDDHAPSASDHHQCTAG